MMKCHNLFRFIYNIKLCLLGQYFATIEIFHILQLFYLKCITLRLSILLKVRLSGNMLQAVIR